MEHASDAKQNHQTATSKLKVSHGNNTFTILTSPSSFLAMSLSSTKQTVELKLEIYFVSIIFFHKGQAQQNKSNRRCLEGALRKHSALVAADTAITLLPSVALAALCSILGGNSLRQTLTVALLLLWLRSSSFTTATTTSGACERVSQCSI